MKNKKKAQTSATEKQPQNKLKNIITNDGK